MLVSQEKAGNFTDDLNANDQESGPKMVELKVTDILMTQHHHLMISLHTTRGHLSTHQYTSFSSVPDSETLYKH